MNTSSMLALRASLRSFLGASVIVLAACGGGGGGGGGSQTPDSIDPADPDAVMETLAVKIGGAEGVLSANGAIPAQSAQNPKIESVPVQSPASNGSTTQIPVVINSNAALDALFLKVPGAAGLITVDLAAAGGKLLTDQKAAFVANGRPKAQETYNIEVTLPPNIEEGEFTFEIAARDSAGNVSNKGSGKVIIARVGTGKLQFSLSWDAEVDLDLHVFEPNGNEVYYGNPGPSGSGGVLDIDDLNGPGSSGRPAGEPEGVENIFWQATAPNGTYIVRVDYFDSSGPAANFVVTVSADGQVLETISRGNFQAGNGCVRIYTLNYGGNPASSQGTVSPGLTTDPAGACGG
ncbi:MAG TPA: hypothetical protein VGE51_06190 [Fontimonas sp.]